MKVCYVDEAGNDVSRDRYLVMVGIVVDASRLNRTQEEFEGVIDDIQDQHGALLELKGTQLIRGRGIWHKKSVKDRWEVIGNLCRWVGARKHKIALAAIDRTRYKELGGTDASPTGCDVDWLAAGLHIALQIQKDNRNMKRNKGKCFLVFDDNKGGVDKLSNLLWKPPSWTDQYYTKQAKRPPLDQIIDTTFGINSQHSGLVQVADLFASIYKRHLDVKAGIVKAHASEVTPLGQCVDALNQFLLPRTCRWPRKPSDDASRWFNSVAPDPLLAFRK